MKGAGQLEGVARGRAQELAAWREQAARVADRPVRTILPDEVIVTLAGEPPRSTADIEALLGNEPEPRLRQGWRAEVIGAGVDRIASGRAAVAYDGAGGLVLVDR